MCFSLFLVTLLYLYISTEVPQFPDHVQYLLIGGGTASFSAVRAIKKHDVTAKV